MEDKIRVLGQLKECEGCEYRKLYHLERGDIWDCTFDDGFRRDCVHDPYEPPESESFKDILMASWFNR